MRENWDHVAVGVVALIHAEDIEITEANGSRGGNNFAYARQSFWHKALSRRKAVGLHWCPSAIGSV